MNTDQLAKAIQLREEGRAKQEPKILHQARNILLELATQYPEQAEITYQLAICYDNLGLGKEAVPYYLQALKQGLTGPNLERACLGLGSTYRALGEYQKSEEILRRGLSEFPESRALQVFLSLTLYNTKNYNESIELLMTNLLETTSDEKLLYFKRGLLYYAKHLDKKWD